MVSCGTHCWNDKHFLSFVIMAKRQLNKVDLTKRLHMNSVEPAQ